MSLAVHIRQHGGPEVLELVDVPVGEPGPGQVRIRHHAIGLNFIDVYHRSGLYPLTLPSGIGMEGAGVIGLPAASTQGGSAAHAGIAIAPSRARVSKDNAGECRRRLLPRMMVPLV